MVIIVVGTVAGCKVVWLVVGNTLRPCSGLIMLSSRRNLCMADDVSDDVGRCSNAVIASKSLSDIIASRRSS